MTYLEIKFIKSISVTKYSVYLSDETINKWNMATVSRSEIKNLLELRDRLTVGDNSTFSNDSIADIYMSSVNKYDVDVIHATNVLIDSLDKSTDRILISLLRQKLGLFNDFAVTSNSITDNEMATTIRGIKKSIKYEILRNNYRYKKIQLIFDRNRCVSCKYHDKKYPTIHNEGSPKCDRCMDRHDLFSTEMGKIVSVAEKKALNFVEDVNNKEFILQKAIINKLNLKLKRNETSKQ